MLRAVVSLFVTLALGAGPPAAQAQTPPPVIGKAYILADISSGQILANDRPDERFEPASLTKIMTAYLVFQALKEKKLALDRTVPVSEKALKASGSRMFIEASRPVTVDELIRGMIVQSGNDACIALAEAVAGNEEVFAQMMNREAQRLGMKNSNFMNSNGLPNPQHYSSARDMYVLAAALIRDFPAEYATYYPMKEYRYNNITQMNRNRLLWLDPSVDGMKSGYTEAAGYCLVASSKRGPRRLMSVLLGSTSESTRAQESQKLLNWGFQFFDAVKLYDKSQPVKSIKVWKGSAPEVKAGFTDDMYITVPKGQADKVKAELLAQPTLVAPISQGQKIGMMRVTLEGKPVGEYPVVALESVGVAGVFGRAWDTLRLWMK
ncbi:MAG: D-alanyl-D-alanine carboxypeptidase family protein [Betaproteobacteria bacterium]